jgi:hypothetical protein
MWGQKAGNHLAITLGLAVLAGLLLAIPLRSQTLLPPKLQAEANSLFDQASQTEPLNCTIESASLFLDFTFHFDAGFRINCPVQEFGGRKTRMTILVRVTPKGGTPVILGTFAVFRGLPLEPLPAGQRKRKVYYAASGGFSVGEGRYRVEVLLADRRHRTCRRAWWINVSHHRQKAVPVVLATQQVSSLRIPPWRGPQAQGGLRLAVLLSAGSFSPRAARLGTGYQTMLLQILSSLLQQVPCKSVRLVAFNLDQERVIYRADEFKPSGFARLQRAFNGLNLGVVSVETLQKRNEWPQMLAKLADEQLTAKPPPDVVIILGRSFRWVRKTPREMLMFPYPGMPGFFYFENGPQNLFPDSLGYLTKSLKGKIYRIGTPHELGNAIQKMLAEVKESGERTETSPSRRQE